MKLSTEEELQTLQTLWNITKSYLNTGNACNYLKTKHGEYFDKNSIFHAFLLTTNNKFVESSDIDELDILQNSNNISY